MAELNLLKVPTDPEAQYEAMVSMFRRMTKREPNLDDKNQVRRELGLTPLPEERIAP